MFNRWSIYEDIMPKHTDEYINFFIAQALTSHNVNLMNYQDPEFKLAVRRVAIAAILSILRTIKDQQRVAVAGRLAFPLVEAINTVHPETSLNMLDYCLVAGFDQLGMRLIRLGAVSSHADLLQRNISNTFGDQSDTQEIIRDINTIVKDCIEIKRNYDQIVATTNHLMPQLIAFGSKMRAAYSPVTLLLLGVGCVALAPILHPMAHGAGIGAAALVSAGLLPGIVSGIRGGTSSVTVTSGAQTSCIETGEIDILQELINDAKQMKQELHAQPEQIRVHGKRAKHLEHHQESVAMLPMSKRHRVEKHVTFALERADGPRRNLGLG